MSARLNALTMRFWTFTGRSGGNQHAASALVSPAMARVLLNLYRGRAPSEHLHGRSMHGASGQAERA
jgi:hypothetical protein